MLSNEDLVLLTILATGALYMNWNTLKKDWFKHKGHLADDEAKSMGQVEAPPILKKRKHTSTEEAA